MKTLYQSLLDYDLALLQAIADCCAIELPTTNQQKAVQELSEALCTPSQLALTLADLPAEALEALRFLVAQGGHVETIRFNQQFGSVRPMGAARLTREQPWREPVNITEMLWYKGLIYRMFHITEQSTTDEIFYIPHDVQPLLNLATPSPAEPSAVQLEPIAAPPRTLSSRGRPRENMFSLLITLQKNALPAAEEMQPPLTMKTQRHVSEAFLAPMPHHAPLAEVEFLSHLANRADLLRMKQGLLKPKREPTRQWLKAGAINQITTLRTTWRNDPTWNELWHLPGLHPQPTGWKNEPLPTRAKLLRHLHTFTEPAHWFSIAEFIKTIKLYDPNFQRTEYDRWYIKDDQDQFLMGLAHWERIEGGLVEYLLTHMLWWLGVVDLGFTASDKPNCFRVTPSGWNFLHPSPIASEQVEASTPSNSIQVGNNFQIEVPVTASLYDRFQVARFAKLSRRTAEQTTYHITPPSINHALANKITIKQIMAFLRRVNHSPLPPQLLDTLPQWAARRGAICPEEVLLLHLREAEVAEKLRQHPQLNPLLGELVTPQAMLVPARHAAQVRRLLTELGYLSEDS